MESAMEQVVEEVEASFGVDGICEQYDFDPSAPPPFKIGDIRAAIPGLCWVRNPWRSLSYVLRDVFVILALAFATIYLDTWSVWPFYWFARGTMFWAIFVLGHDWRISHRTHHQNHGHVENDESWVPLTEKVYKSLNESTKKLRFKIPFPMFAYPFYLWTRSPGKEGSHFNPSSNLFAPNEKLDELISTACWSIMAALLLYLSFVVGPISIFKLYFIPYWIFVVWLDLVTYLHHHDYEKKLPWYRGKEWSYLRGGLTTVDRDYGWINNIHHDVGTHVVHHLFPRIPHYHLVEATKAAKPILGNYYREPKSSGPFPFHLMKIVMNSLRQDHYVSDTGDIVFYQSDFDLFKDMKRK